MVDYDLIIIGGGLAGSALAKVMSETGARVLVVEREHGFRDRVRGESMHPWGVSEARALGIYASLVASCAHEILRWESYPGPLGYEHPVRRDLLTTTGHHRAGELAFYHPAMQDAMAAQALSAGAELRRGAVAQGITTDEPGSPRVVVSHEGKERSLSARLIVGADGRRSMVREWAAFPVRREPDRLRITGALLTGMPIDHEVVRTFRPPTFGSRVLFFPLRDERVRVYFITGCRDVHRVLSGSADLPQFADYCVEAGVPRAWFDQAQLAGPLATFEGADRWVEHPANGNVVLIGDAASASDPAWGCGTGLTLRDVRLLRDQLTHRDDWVLAAHEYAAAHAASFTALRTAEAWMTRILYDQGAAADRVRERALPALANGHGPDFAGLGPESPVDEETRIALFGDLMD
jgi:menaquinone-9 beta-reductase